MGSINSSCSEAANPYSGKSNYFKIGYGTGHGDGFGYNLMCGYGCWHIIKLSCIAGYGDGTGSGYEDSHTPGMGIGYYDETGEG
jgi:hypothetical protein